ncbi:MAG: hypothetical protein CVU86_03245 [Firmicutes bacterium HGW-Firmicutes-11]|nr:MAG: hypothetical protein CVU86_03245 [Firmicutes bacterium HGW-Firmicutes-11]
MKISYMRAYIELVNNLNFTRAANELFLTQPTLSKYILRIEETLGVQLLIRSKHSVELTVMGRIVFDEFQEIVKKYDDLLNKVSVCSMCNEGELKLGMLYYAIKEYITPTVNSFKEKHPNIKLSFFSYQPNPLINDLLNDAIDVGLIFHLDFEGSDQLYFHKICQEKFVIAVSKEHRLAMQKRISLKELKDENIVIIDDIQKNFQTKFFKTHNIKPQNIILTKHIDTLEFTLHDSNGVAVVASHIKCMNRSNMVLLDIAEEENCYVDMAFAYKKNNINPAIPLFLKVIDQIFKGSKSFNVK